MTIRIKNVTGARSNDCAIFELKREGYPEGSIIENVCYTKSNHACHWENCVAWVGETCEIIKTPKL
jgi:hypothetical protein